MGERVRKKWGVRIFLSVVEEMDGWWQHYDAEELAAALTEAQWQRVQANLDASTTFINAVAIARESNSRPRPS